MLLQIKSIRTKVSSQTVGRLPVDLLPSEPTSEDHVCRQGVEDVDQLDVKLVYEEVTEEKPSVDQ